MRIYNLLLAAAVTFAVCACGKKSSGEPDIPAAVAPALVSVNPADGSVVSGETLEVKFTFDQNVKLPDARKVTIDNEAEVTNVLAYNKDVTIKLAGLRKGVSYTLSVTQGAISGFKSNPAGALSYKFSVKADEPDYQRNPSQSLTDASATPNAGKLYAYLLQNYGKKTLSGAMGGTAWETSYTDMIANVSGEYPAIVGFDYLFLNWPAKAWSDCPDYGDITPVKNAWEAGNIIQVGWHWSVPSKEGETDINKYAFYSSGTTFDINKALEDGTWQRKVIDSQIRKIAGYLKLLQDAGIPVIFRPLHEAAGDYSWGAWFWWGEGGAEPCTRLWKYLRDQLQGTYGLHNLIWVWTVQTNDQGKLCTDLEKARAWYPGDDYVDIVGADLYVAKGTSQSAAFKFVNNSVKGKKMVVLSEFGNLLDTDKFFAEDAPWGFFMNWCNYEDGKPVLYCKNSDGSYSWNNTASDWKTALANTKVINRNDVIF